MRLDAVMDEVALVLHQITGLRVTAWPPDSVSAPAGYVSYPQSIDYDQAYERGEDQFTDLPFVLVADKVTARSARERVSGWTAGDGSQSVIRAMHARTKAREWTSCDDVSVTSAEFDVETIAGTPYLAAVFKATVVGPGED
jgi:hypothetical protein